MEYVLTAAEMKKCDETAIKEYGIASLVLMERAALETVNAVLEKYGDEIFVGVIAGCGNNGGDGIAAARILQEHGVRVEINMVGETKKLTDETKVQLEIARKLNIPIYYGVEHTLYDVIIDALFGIGITRTVEGKYRKAIEEINASKAKVVSVDIPSGVNTDDGSIMGCAVKADMTVTFAYRKIGLMLYPGASCAGEVRCVPIGIPSVLTDKKRTGVVTFTDKEADLKLPDRSRSGNKGTFGKVLLAAGSRSMGGACQLSALAAYRIGAGMVRVFTAEENRESLLRKLPEAIVDTYADPDNEQGLSAAEQRTLKESLAWADVIAIGPGIGTEACACQIAEQVFANADIPVIADADALNIAAKTPEIFKTTSANLIITPHPGEMARLCKKQVSDILNNLRNAAEQFAKQYDLICVLKDAVTVTAGPSGTWLNTSGCHAMAKGGSGDILTGLIAALAAQGMKPEAAAYMGVYLHGMAGEAAAEQKGSYSVLARDILNAVGTVFRTMAESRSYEIT